MLLIGDGRILFFVGEKVIMTLPKYDRDPAGLESPTRTRKIGKKTFNYRGGREEFNVVVR